MGIIMKQEEREKNKKNAELGESEKIEGKDISEKLSLLTKDKGAKIIEKNEFLDLNDALL